MSITIPIAIPDIGQKEKGYVMDALESTWISSTGPYIARFEREFAALCGTRAAIAVSNGTVALHLALLTMGLRPGDEVIVPSLTYVATANAVRYCGAEPVFVDVDPQSWCLDTTKVEGAITARTRGIIAVHLYGHPADMDAINHTAAVYGLWVVEDAAEAPLATYKGRPTGGLAAVGTFSFYGNKIFSCGEGGAVTLNDPGMELRARVLKGQGVDPQRRYFFPVTGYNYRLTNPACAFLCAQLERREEILQRRHEIYRIYRESLFAISGLGFQPVASWAELSPWLFSVTIDSQAFGRTRDQVIAFLEERGIDTRPFFVPLHTLPPFCEGSQRRKENLPVTDQLAKQGMNLPTYPGMTDEMVRRVADSIRQSRT